MIGKTLGLYIFRRYLAMVAWFFVGIFALAYLIDFTEFSSRASALPKYSMTGALLIAAMHIPMIMQQVVPFIALFAGMAALISLNRKNELVVARASGISAWQFLMPACAGALLFGIASIVVLNPIAAWGFAKANTIEAEWRSNQSNLTLAQQTPWLRQKSGDIETIIGAKAVVGDGTILSGVTFLHLDSQGDIIKRQDARRAKLEDGYWLLTDVRESAAGREPADAKEARVPTSLKPEFVKQRLVEPDSVPFFELLGRIRVANGFGYAAWPLRMQFHSLIALPALLITMTLIAATVSLRFMRFGQSGSMIVGGIAAGFLLYVVSILVKAFGSSGFMPPAIAAWIPVLVAGFTGVTFLLHKEDG